MRVYRRMEELDYGKLGNGKTCGSLGAMEGNPAWPGIKEIIMIRNRMLHTLSETEKKRILEVCGFCGRFGHFKRRCPGVICLFCSRIGHMKVVCI